jgi:RNA polymerase sigma-70 factor (ECF subfamily)
MTPATTPPTAAPADDPVRAALRDPRTLQQLRQGARVLLRRLRAGAPQTLLDQLTDDVVARTAETALRAHFDPDRGTVSAWLSGINRNIVRKEIGARHVPAACPGAVDWETLLPDAAPPPDEQAAARDDAERLRAALVQLDPQDRQLLEWHYFDDLPATEIGRRLSTPAATIRVRLHRARKAVEAILAPSREEANS